MNFAIYTMTGVKRPKASPGELRDLRTTWEHVRSAAVSCKAEADLAISDVMAKNKGEAANQFYAYSTGSGSASQQLQKIADAALATRDAHEAGAQVVESAQTAMDAVANGAALALLKAQLTPLPMRINQMRTIVNTARVRLTMLSLASAAQLTAVYAAVSLPEPLSLTEAERRGSLPPGVTEAWAKMTDAERMRLLDAIADDVTGGDFPGGKPDIIYYSNRKPQPPGTVPPPGPEWNGYNGAASGGKVYMNYDKLQNSPTLMHTMVHEIQHIKQARLKDRLTVLEVMSPVTVALIKAGKLPDPFVAQGTTIHEVERWRVQYQSTSNPQQKPYYTHQPTEIDARRAGTEYLDQLTAEKVEEMAK